MSKLQQGHALPHTAKVWAPEAPEVSKQPALKSSFPAWWRELGMTEQDLILASASN